MTDPAPRYSIEPYIGNGEPQWTLYKTHAAPYHNAKAEHCVGLGHNTEALICIVNSLYKARELLAHMKHMKETSEGDDDYESDLKRRIKDALWIAKSYGGLDSNHHKAWIIDQMVRALTQDSYGLFIAEATSGEEGPDTYEWDEGTPP